MAKNKSKVDRDTAIHDAVQGIIDLAKRDDFDATEFRGVLDQLAAAQKRLYEQHFIVSAKPDADKGYDIAVYSVQPQDVGTKLLDAIPADFYFVGWLTTYLLSDSKRKWDNFYIGEPSEEHRAIMRCVIQGISEKSEEGFEGFACETQREENARIPAAFESLKKQLEGAK